MTDKEYKSRKPSTKKIELTVKKELHSDGVGTLFGTRHHETVRVSGEGGIELWIREWGPGQVEVFIMGYHSWSIRPHSGNTFTITWQKPRKKKEKKT